MAAPGHVPSVPLQHTVHVAHLRAHLPLRREGHVVWPSRRLQGRGAVPMEELHGPAGGLLHGAGRGGGERDGKRLVRAHERVGQGEVPRLGVWGQR